MTAASPLAQFRRKEADSFPPWMVFDLHSEPLVGWVERRAFGYRPALEDAVPLQSEVVMQMRGRMFLNHEAALLVRNGMCAARLRGDMEVSLASVFCESHTRKAMQTARRWRCGEAWDLLGNVVDLRSTV
jgi:hypothetical protein